MTTSAAMAPALMAFPQYPELPPELRLAIIEETLDSLAKPDKWSWSRSRGMTCGKSWDRSEFTMSTYATVDRQWNRAVELRLFKDITLFPQPCFDDWTSNSEVQQELVDFGTVCGKRSGRLSRILLRLHGFRQASFENHPHLQILFQLFDLMKDWNHEDREQEGLIELGLEFLFVRHPSSWMNEHLLELGRFPQVPVIGRLHESKPECCTVHLHPCILAALCQKLPSVHHGSLTLPSGQSEHVSTEDFIRECASHNAKAFSSHQEWKLLILVGSMDLLRLHKPNLTHMDLRTGLTRNRVITEPIPTLLPVIQRLSNSPSPWSDRLVSLKIYHNIVVEDFLRSASKAVWPNLKVMKLVGAIDDERQDWWNPVDEEDEDDVNAVADESSSKIIAALTTALPSMPKATRFQIRMIPDTDVPHKAYKVSIHLGNIAKTKKPGKELPCIASIIPDSNSGIARMSGIYPRGSTTIQLQDVVRVQRRQELEVFACGEDGYYDWHLHNRRTPHRPCARWDRQTENWEAVFRNGMDLFIYELGQYWEAVDHMDNKSW